MNTPLCSPLSSFDDEGCMRLPAEAKSHGLFLDAVFQTTNAPSTVSSFFFHDVKEYYPLFMNTRFQSLLGDSPYLCRFESAEHPFFAHLVSQQPGWGFFMLSRATFKQQVKHWQHLLEVELQDGRKTHLRLYDGNICSLLVPACNASDLRLLMGPCAAILVRQKETGRWLHVPHPEASTLSPVSITQLWQKQQFPGMWRLQPRHFTFFTAAMYRVEKTNMQYLLWQESGETALKLDTIYGSLAGFIDTVYDEIRQLGQLLPAEREQYTLLRFYTDLDPVKKEHLATFMCNPLKTLPQRLDASLHLIRENA